MEVDIIVKNKKDFLDLLLLADEQEDMIDKYLDRGTMFALYDGDLKGICVVTDEGGGSYEIQNLATYEQYQRKGYGRCLINYACDYFRGKGSLMYVGTGDVPSSVNFYERSGFIFSHRIENYILDHYINPIFEDGIQLIDKVYFKRGLND
jgi:GNAT superfamily N-acetyltransferase